MCRPQTLWGHGGSWWPCLVPAWCRIWQWSGPPWHLTSDCWEDTWQTSTHCLRESIWAEACLEARLLEWWNTELRWGKQWTSSGSLYTRGGLRGNLVQWWPQWWPRGPQLATRGAAMGQVEKEILFNCTSSLSRLYQDFYFVINISSKKAKSWVRNSINPTFYNPT